MERNEIEQLYLRCGPLVYRRCLRLLRNPESARDATQEVFVRALTHAPELIWDRECLPWLYRVATRLCLNRLRDARPLEIREPAELPEPLQGTGVEAQVTARGALEALRRELDEETWMVAVYAMLDGMTQDEIAEVTGRSRRTIGKRLAALERTVAALKGRSP
jgi:RNA polymerase sigma-70 factor (ECF subfamily)